MSAGVRLLVLFLMLANCKAAPPPSHPAPITPPPPLPAATSTTPQATVPPASLYEPDFASLHAGYLKTLATAHGEPLPADAPLFAGNAIQLHGNSYTVARVSLLILGDSASIREGDFDPHAMPTTPSRPATPEETARAERAEQAAAPEIHFERAQLLITAPLPIDTALCSPCHQPPDVPRAALVYHFRELADD